MDIPRAYTDVDAFEERALSFLPIGADTPYAAQRLTAVQRRAERLGVLINTHWPESAHRKGIAHLLAAVIGADARDFRIGETSANGILVEGRAMMLLNENHTLGECRANRVVICDDDGTSVYYRTDAQRLDHDYAIYADHVRPATEEEIRAEMAAWRLVLPTIDITAGLAKLGVK